MGMGFKLNYLACYWRVWEKQEFPLVDLGGEASSTCQKGNPSHGACEGRRLGGHHELKRESREEGPPMQGNGAPHFLPPLLFLLATYTLSLESKSTLIIPSTHG